MEGQKPNEPNPIPISALLDNNFFKKDDVKKHMKFLWEVMENEEFFIWISTKKQHDK